MSHHTATLQYTSATAFDFACTIANRIYWLDDNYVQPFYSWATPRLRDVAISGIYWAFVTLIDVALWLTDTNLQCMARDAQAIALFAFAKDHPLPNFPVLAPATVPLALPMALGPTTAKSAPVVSEDSVTPSVVDANSQPKVSQGNGH